jgi:hypothetical protein
MYKQSQPKTCTKGVCVLGGGDVGGQFICGKEGRGKAHEK